jgi:uncharacterized membrane protein
MRVDFPIGDFVRRAWEVFQANTATFLISGVVAFLVTIGASVVGSFLAGAIAPALGPVTGAIVAQVISQFATALVTGPLLLGLYAMYRRVLAGQAVAWNDIFTGFEHFVPAVLAYFLISLLSSIGFLLCVLPGLVVVVLYLPAYCVLDEQRAGAWNAMEASRAMVAANFMQWAIVGLVTVALTLAGVLLCGVGLLVTMPLAIMVIVQAYDLSKRGTSLPPLPGDSLA